MVQNAARFRPSKGPRGRGEYEEYHPYGTTAWWAEKSGIQVSRKRYRYTGMERDEETGMAYHHHRYYLPWLGRWASADPAGLVEGGNRYVYARGSPVGGKDPSGLAAAQFPRPPSIPPGLEKRLLIEADIWTDKVTALADAAAAVKSDPMGALVQAARRTPAGLAAQGQWSDAAGAYVDALAAPLRTGADALMGAPEQVAHVAGYWTESDPGVIRAHRERSLEITAAQAELGGLAGAPAGGELIRRGLRSVPRLLDDAPMPMGLTVRRAADASKGARLLPNQGAATLADELAQAASVGVSPMRAGASGFDDLVNQGTIKWVITESGELMVGPHTRNGVEISHAVLSGGAPVRAAGQANIAAAGGQRFGIDISAHSGHFMNGMPASVSDEVVEMGRAAFSAAGVSF